MARPKLDRSKAAAVLMDSHFFPDTEVARTHGVSVGTLKRYRQRVGNDPELAAEVQRLKDAALTPARLTIKDAIANGVRWMDETLDKIPRTVDGLTAVRLHVRSLHEMQLESKVVEAKIDSLQRPYRAP
jgi:hypothetical protein